MSNHAEDIIKALDVLHMHCDAIQQSDHGCKRCPLRKFSACLEETDPITLAEDMTKAKWETFIDYEDDEEDEEPLTEKEEYEMQMEALYERLPKKEIDIYGYKITIVG